MTKKKTFEKSIEQLEKIVKELESGELPLDKAMKKFEDGIELSRYCSDILDETENKISILLKDSEGNSVKKNLMNKLKVMNV